MKQVRKSNSIRLRVAVAVSALAVGTAGLISTALPAAAENPPSLPPVSAEDLVASALKAEAPAFVGTVEVVDRLGLPELGETDFSFDSARIYHDGDQSARIGIQKGSAEITIVKSEAGVTTYDSAKNTASQISAAELEAKAERNEHQPDKGKHESMSDPAAAATELIEKLSGSSNIAVDGTAMVAKRPAYELVLTPKPTEKTVLREARVAIDSETRLPLRFELFANGSQESVFELGFDTFTAGAQPASLFEFSIPQGAKLVDADETDDKEDKEHKGEDARFETTVVGDGWDTVITGKIDMAEFTERAQAEGTDVKALLGQITKPVSGSYGNGYLFTTAAGGALLTEDGRFAIGAVPESVLTESLPR